MKKIYLMLMMLGLFPAAVFAQTLTDGLLMPKKDFCTGFMYTHDQWTNYWEGDLKRKNGNIGTITTQSIMWFGNYGITDRINVIAMLPYVKTKASQGVLTGMEGIQDLTVGVKYNFVRHDFANSVFKAFAGVNFALPVSDYSPDYLPLSIGSASKRINWRVNTWYRMEQGWFANASGGYTWRSNVTLDRPAHMNEGHLVNSEEAFLPNVLDLFVSAGFHKGALQVELEYIAQHMVEGDDIRRQGMPEVGNQMNYQKAGALIMYYLPAPRGMAVRGSATFTLGGRNVGESTTILGGLLYTIHFSKKSTAE